MVVDFVEVLLQIGANGFGFVYVPFVEFSIHFKQHFCTDFGEVIDEIQRVLDFVGDACREFTQTCEFFGLDELGLGGFEFKN